MDETSETTDVESRDYNEADDAPEVVTVPHDPDDTGALGNAEVPTGATADSPLEGQKDAPTNDEDDSATVGADDAAEDGDTVEAEAATPAEPDITVESVIEALLFATDSPLPAAKVAQLVGVGDARDVKKHIAALNERYEQSGSAFRVEAIAKGHQMLTLPVYNGWVRKLLRVREETKLSPAAMETLAVVAYKQPVLRADVEVIRGVSCGEMLNKLREMNLVKIVGRAEEPGRPMLYGTTNHFLEVFGLGSLDDLPSIEALPAPP